MNFSTFLQLVVVLVSSSLFADVCLGDSLKSMLSSYQDDRGYSRSRAAFDLSLGDKSKEQTAAVDYTMSVQHDETLYDIGAAGDQANEEIPEKQTSDSVTLVASQNWDKLTQTRVLGGYTKAGETRSANGGLGVSRWFRHENFRISLDLSRTWVGQPEYSYLDVDSEIVTVPPNVQSTGTSVALRQLVTPSTVADYIVSYVATSNRPAAVTYSLKVRQYIALTDGALHAGASRAINKGKITTQTSYGQVTAWLADASYLQNMWSGARAKVGYRYYMEDEKTRAYEDEYRFGSDLISLGYAQYFGKNAKYDLEILASRYMTSRSIDADVTTEADIYEIGLTAKF